MSNIKVVSTPVVHDLITKLRDIKTPSHLFRIYSEMLTTFLIYEATSNIKTSSLSVDTQTGKKYIGIKLKEKIACLAILRASLGMLTTAMKVLPDSEFHVIGLKRNENNAFDNQPLCYLERLHEMGKVDRVFILDPMLATGGSMISAIRIVKEKYNFRGRIDVISYISAKAGVKAIQDKFKNVFITTAGLDEKLNDKAYIVPGLGDAGDRYFGLNTDLKGIQ